MRNVSENFQDRDFWIHENLLYSEPNFRLRKCARLIVEITRGRPCDLLDVGCGPATLRTLLEGHVNYHGIDIALHQSAPYLRELDFVRAPIAFDAKHFDVVVALGVFEYMGLCQRQKFAEIRSVLRGGGTFVVSYINFNHFRRKIWPAYNNIRSVREMAKDLSEAFNVTRCFPVSHHWKHRQPGRNALPQLQLRFDWDVPILSRYLAVEYFFVCSSRS